MTTILFDKTEHILDRIYNELCLLNTTAWQIGFAEAYTTSFQWISIKDELPTLEIGEEGRGFITLLLVVERDGKRWILLENIYNVDCMLSEWCIKHHRPIITHWAYLPTLPEDNRNEPQQTQDP